MERSQRTRGAHATLYITHVRDNNNGDGAAVARNGEYNTARPTRLRGSPDWLSVHTWLLYRDC